MKTTRDFYRMKENNEKIVMMTAYDYPAARQAQEAGVEMILVGDSLGMVVLGYDSTLPVTVEDMIHHAKAVRRGAPTTFVVVDMPFASYHGDVFDTLKIATRMMQQTNANALKLEGAGEVITVMQKLTTAGIPCVAHLGLLPQSAQVLGGYQVQGRSMAEAKQLVTDAKACEQAGAVALVLECVPHQLAQLVAKELTIPVIGIGAGAQVDGQVLVYHDVLGYGKHHVPKFVAQYANVDPLMTTALSNYAQQVKAGTFPTLAQSFSMKEETLEVLYGGVKA